MSRFDRGWLATIALLVLFTLGGIPYLFATRSAEVKLEARNSLETGDLTLAVDGRTIYTRHLGAPVDTGGLARILGRNHEAFEALLKIPPGRHMLDATVAQAGESEPLRESIVVDLAPGESRTLRLSTGRAFGRPVQLKLE